jgi:hypothetical protein
MGYLWLLLVVAVLVAILSRPQMAKVLRGLLKDREELALFAMFLLVEVGLVAVVLATLGPRVGFYVILGSVASFVIWAMKPPAKPR